MKSKLLNEVTETLLMGPGPSCVPNEVYEALSTPSLGHLDPHFIRIMDDIKTSLQTLFQTKNKLTIPVSGTGSAGMETCFVNLVEPGNKVLILSNGVFGKRMQDLAGRLGAEVDVLEFEWGTPVVPADVEKKLEGSKYDLIAVVHAETSTGVRNPVEEISKIVTKTGALFLVDSVTSLGGIPVKVDEWKIDAIYSGTQKCLSCPPGLSPVSMSDRAVKKIMDRKSKVPNWYLDLTMIINYWAGEKRAYHHTAPINMLYALNEAVHLILDEGLENVYKRHAEIHEYLGKELEKIGLNFYVEKAYRLPMLNAVTIPDGVDDASIRTHLLKNHQIEIGGGLGPLAGKIWRIGIMGHTARKENVDRLIKGLKEVL
ncbi:MAG: alanine--glyoxylate aminotransferase family protein [Cyclobacteriaceae bacterium]|nr:alanine--glyoxylate aminotransferase family protein [Cyclobacteriaceae bacterium SS2]